MDSQAGKFVHAKGQSQGCMEFSFFYPEKNKAEMDSALFWIWKFG
jgi:hypothetical protein